jgi:hypothetical protein
LEQPCAVINIGALALACPCRIPRLPFVLWATIHKEDAMKYMLLIHQGTTPLPGSPEWEALPDEEKGRSTPTTRPSTRRRA